MKRITFMATDKQAEELIKFSREAGIRCAFLIRMAIDDLFKDREKLRQRLFPVNKKQVPE